MAVRAAELLIEFRGDARHFDRTASDVTRSLGNVARDAGLLRGALAGGGSSGLVGAFGAAAVAGVTYRDKVDRLTRSFTTLTGSSLAATKHLKELQQFAARTPFSFEEVANASQKFQNMGIAAKDVLPYLEAVGNAVARAGGSSADIAGVAKALADLSARGKVSAQEMNQLANHYVDGWKVLEAELGKTRGELFKMAEMGEISSETFLRAFRKAHEGGTAMKDQMSSLSGSFTTLKDNVLLLLSQAFSPLHEKLNLLTIGAAKLSDELVRSGKEGQQAGFSIENAFIKAMLARELYFGQPTPRERMPRAEGSGVGGTIAAGDAAAEAQALGRQAEAAAALMNAQLGAAMALKAAQEAVQPSLDAAREALKRAMIETQNFGKSEAEAAVNSLKWATGIRELSEAVMKLPIPDLIALTEQQIRQREAMEATASFSKDVAALTGEFAEQKTAVSRVNEEVGEYLKRMAEATGKPAFLTEAQIAAVEYARSLAAINDLLGRTSEFKGFGLSDLKPGDVSAGIPRGTAAPVTPVFKADAWETLRQTWRTNLQEMAYEGQGIFAQFFFDLSEGWKGALAGMGLAFLQSLQAMAAQAAASAVWGFVLSAVGSVAGGSFKPTPFASTGVNWASALVPRAEGGPVFSGSPYLVGERGPELFIPRGGGDIVPNSALAAGGGVTINVYGVRNPSEFLAAPTHNQIQRKYRRALQGDAMRGGR